VAHTYEFVAALRGLTVDELAQQVEENAYRAFPRLAALGGRL
jgi:Tat protein secretion system quality control protein TatD with DNase activity